MPPPVWRYILLPVPHRRAFRLYSRDLVTHLSNRGTLPNFQHDILHESPVSPLRRRNRGSRSEVLGKEDTEMLF